MIISHKNRYLFVELPRTGSTAVSKELCELYDGKEILKKHATYSDFVAKAGDEERKYFVFSAIRNPMDKILSLYFKYKTDHRGYEDPEIYRKGNRFIEKLMKNQFRYVQKEEASFPQFFKRYYRLPYDDWSCLDHARFDYVMRFERLSQDFAEVIRRIGIDPVRQLPLANKTAGKEAAFSAYYTHDIQDRARWVFGPYFEKWGYDFPSDWDDHRYALNRPLLKLINAFRIIYWRALR